MGIYGQDWASYQGSTPSAKGIDFVFLKVTEGTTYESPVWKSQYAEAIKAGLAIGFYHYPHMHNNPDAEVNYFLSKVTPKIGEMVVLDWEGYDANNRNLSPSELLSYKEEYLRFMKSKLPHNPVGLYCNTSYWLSIDKASNAGDFLWIATANKPAGQPGIQYNWLFHQYGASGVDRDYCRLATKTDLINWIKGFAPKTAGTTIHLSHIIAAATTDPTAKQGHTTHAAEVRVVENALWVEGLLEKKYASDGSFGSKTLEAYAKWQKKCADGKGTHTGIPGKGSLTLLGKKHYFTVL